MGTTVEDTQEIRRAKALELRAAGATYSYIAKELQISRDTAHKDIQHELKALAEQRCEMGKSYIDLQLRRLDRVMFRAEAGFQKATSVNAQMHALDVITRAIDRQCKLLGLESPQLVNALVAEMYGAKKPPMSFVEFDRKLREMGYVKVESTPQLPRPADRGHNGSD